MSNYLWTQLYVYQMYSFFVCGCLRNKLQTLGDLLSVSLQALAVPNTVILCVCVVAPGHRLPEAMWESDHHSAASKQMEMLTAPNLRSVQKPAGEVSHTCTHIIYNLYTYINTPIPISPP